MPDVAVVIPSRGRPEQCGRLVARIAETAITDPTVLVVVDHDEPMWSQYITHVYAAGTARTAVVLSPGSGHVTAINSGARRLLAWRRRPAAIVKLDDDHWPQTSGWDSLMLTALARMGGGIVYGDDLLQGAHLPTAPAISTSLIEALGWMCPPVLTHMFVDDFWRDLGQAAWCLQYLPGVVIEHRHPAVGKADLDDGYRRVGSQEVFDTDRAAYTAWQADPEGFPAAVFAVRTMLLGAHADV